MIEATTTTTRPSIRPRAPGVTFDASIPRYWFGGSPLATHITNGVNLLFPIGERFFVRSVRHYLDRIEDPILREQVRGFCGQEARHGRAHEEFFDVLTAQGFDLSGFLKWYERLGPGFIEPIAPPSLRLATTVALEHFTAIMAENALRERFVDLAHPALRQLLLWHAAEEIEHKAVAFDVLREVNPSYALRMAGLVMATILLSAFWFAATRTLIRQDDQFGRVPEPRAIADYREKNGIARRVFVRGIREYLRRDFHPSQNDNYHLARAFLAEVGMAA